MRKKIRKIIHWLHVKYMQFIVSHQYGLRIPIWYILMHDLDEIAEKSKFRKLREEFYMDAIDCVIATKIRLKGPPSKERLLNEEHWHDLDVTKFEVRVIFCSWISTYNIETGEDLLRGGGDLQRSRSCWLRYLENTKNHIRSSRFKEKYCNDNEMSEKEKVSKNKV